MYILPLPYISSSKYVQRSQRGKLTHVFLWQYLTMHMLGLHQNDLYGFEKENECTMYFRDLHYVSKLLCKVNYNNNKFIHAPTYTYNKVMRLLELVGVVVQYWFIYLRMSVYDVIYNFCTLPTSHNLLESFKKKLTLL